jgi:predicted nucleic acid-binding protein
VTAIDLLVAARAAHQGASLLHRDRHVKQIEAAAG